MSSVYNDLCLCLYEKSYAFEYGLQIKYVHVYGPYNEREYEKPFSIERLRPRRNNAVFERLYWITESDYFKDLLQRKPPNDDPELIAFIRYGRRM